MTADNFDSLLNGLRQRQPFRFFTVELNGGHRFEVDHAGALVVRDGVAVFLAPGGVPIWFDHESVNQIIGTTAESAPRQNDHELSSAGYLVANFRGQRCAEYGPLRMPAWRHPICRMIDS